MPVMAHGVLNSYSPGVVVRTSGASSLTVKLRVGFSLLEPPLLLSLSMRPFGKRKEEKIPSLAAPSLEVTDS
jgi:hypothetical protein